MSMLNKEKKLLAKLIYLKKILIGVWFDYIRNSKSKKSLDY